MDNNKIYNIHEIIQFFNKIIIEIDSLNNNISVTTWEKKTKIPQLHNELKKLTQSKYLVSGTLEIEDIKPKGYGKVFEFKTVPNSKYNNNTKIKTKILFEDDEDHAFYYSYEKRFGSRRGQKTEIDAVVKSLSFDTKTRILVIELEEPSIKQRKILLDDSFNSFKVTFTTPIQKFEPPSKPVKSNDGCYIATVVYGNPLSKEVIHFKLYRDTVLLNNFWGRLFVKTYYFTSPTISKYLKNKPKTNRFIKRYILDILYKKILTK